MPGRVNGATLSGEVDRYCLRLGITKAALSRASGVPAQTLSHLLRSRIAKPETVLAVRSFIAANPDRLPDTMPSAPERVIAPVPVKTTAKAVNIMVKATPAELVASALLETPSDLVRHVAVRWPQVWQAVLLRARADGKLPGVTLLAVIERGLGIEITCD
ncbi:hypothetical protein ASE90_01800 [Sphingomonas sp. Leaf67]|uniref:hypothetical protein n=1 Tax=Sphingomonas sp. Leaf67 TaxID=1736230 RepID=UPI0006FCA731|nr:hypothetical protein [Sphingomonas sp. Leaf67]KQN91562.1 hypothetical protein ASE90_01800 [Sphingomonas sp. Leaf67]